MAKEMVLVANSGVRGYLDKHGEAWLNTEDTAKGLGVVKIDKKNGKTYTRINAYRIKTWLVDFGIICFENGDFSEHNVPKSTEDDLPEYISEPAFYYMAFKANSEAARKFQYIVTTKILPAIRKTGSYGRKPSAQISLEYLSKIKKAAKEHDREMLAALYAQCEEYGIIAPHYEISEVSHGGSSTDGDKYTMGLPAAEILGNGKVVIRQHELVEINGEKKTLKEWCALIGLSRTGIRSRIARGLSLEKALTKKKLFDKENE